MKTVPQLPADSYLNNFRFSRTVRYVVRPQNTTHVLTAEMSNGRVYVCVEDMVNGVWTIRKEGPAQSFSRYTVAEAYAAEVHRAETRAAQLRASAPTKKE